MTKGNQLNRVTDPLSTFDDPVQPAFNNIQLETFTSPAMTIGAAPTLTQAMYLTETGTAGAVSVADINQGQIGDCFLLSSIGEMGLLQPRAIPNMIHVNADGTETVTLYKASNGSLPSWNTTAFKAISITVNNVFPNYSVNNGATQDVLNGQKEIWSQVLEKAVATLSGGYSAIAYGGSPLVAMGELTGHAASFMSPASLTLAALQSFVAAGDLIVMDTLSRGALPNNLVNNHAYIFEGVTGTGASALAHFGNPWGFAQPTAMLVSQLSHGFSEVDIGHLS